MPYIVGSSDTLCWIGTAVFAIAVYLYLAQSLILISPSHVE